MLYAKRVYCLLAKGIIGDFVLNDLLLASQLFPKTSV